MCNLIGLTRPRALPTFSGMAKRKKKPAETAEDKLFERGSPKSRELLKESKKLKREQQRKEWWKEHGDK